MNFWLHIIFLFIAAYFGHLFTKWKYFRETLYSRKIDAYVQITHELVTFLYKCERDTSIVSIFESFQNIQLITQNSYLFLPARIYGIIIERVNLTAENIATIKVSQKDIDSIDILTEPASSFKFLDRDPDGKTTIINVFALLTAEIPNILDELKKDTGIYKHNTKFFDFSNKNT